VARTSFLTNSLVCSRASASSRRTNSLSMTPLARPIMLRLIRFGATGEAASAGVAGTLRQAAPEPTMT
jgi:hypothetical protein